MKHTIELNGKRYNALTGELLDKQHLSHLMQPSSPTSKKAEHHNQTKTSPHAAKHPSRPSVHHKGKKSLTLMRRGLKKPVIHNPSRAHNESRHPIITIAQLHSDSARLARISRIPRSSLISKFGH